MLRTICRAIQLLAKLEPHGDFALAAQRDQFFDARPPGSLGDEHSIERTPCAQGFTDGMDSYEQGHYDKGTSWMAGPKWEKRKTTFLLDATEEIPDKLYFRIGDVARLAGIKPYVLRFWETEFPALGLRRRNPAPGIVCSAVRTSSLCSKLSAGSWGEQRFTIEGARQTSGVNEAKPGRNPCTASKRSGPKKKQPSLFYPDPTPLLEDVRRELRALADMLQ